MDFNTLEHEGRTVLALSGDVAGGGGLTRQAVELMEQSRDGLIIDLSDVRFINSGGLGDLVQVVARANTRNARVILASPSPFVTGVLHTTQLNRFFQVAATLDAAAEMLH